MNWPFHIATHLDKKIQEAILTLNEFNEEFTANVHPADPRFGEFQANGVLSFAKKQGCNPRELATTLVDSLRSKNVFPATDLEMEIAGPGFINFHFNPDFYLDWLKHLQDKSSLKAAGNGPLRGTVVAVDFSSPNTAKQMHVGHIRSTVIGETLCRLLEFQGARTIRDNHVGDWGTQFGILIMAIHHFGMNLDADAPDALEQLEGLYRKGSALTKEFPEQLEIG